MTSSSVIGRSEGGSRGARRVAGAELPPPAELPRYRVLVLCVERDETPSRACEPAVGSDSVVCGL